MMKTICVYHSRDLDGWMSAAIVKKWFLDNRTKEYYNQATNVTKRDDVVVDVISTYKGGESLHLLGWDYGDAIPDLSEYDKVIMVDISFPFELKDGISESRLFKLFNRLDVNFIWIDHHVSAINDNIGSGYIDKSGADTSTVFNGIRHTKFAACELTWEYFFPNEEMPEIVRLLGRYDCFGHKGTDEEQKVMEFQYGARQCISNYKEAYNHLIDEANDYKTGITTADAIHSNGSVIYEYLCTEAKQIYKKAFPIKFKNRNLISPDLEIGNTLNYINFLCVNQERFNPINFGIDYHKEGYDGFACFWLKDGKWNFSLYNNDGNVDCSIIAKEYKGGGHKGAAGFIVDFNKLNEIINE